MTGLREHKRVFAKNIKYHGYVLMEIILAIFLLGVLITAFTMSLSGFARFNRFQLVRQQCISAAQAELDSITALGKPIPDEDFKRLWPKLNVSIKQTDGADQWQGLKFVEVQVNGLSFNQPVKIKLSRYIAGEIILAGQEL
jgi:type II secretory pathway pseudopilin PulG